MEVRFKYAITVLVVGVSTGCATVRPTSSVLPDDRHAAVRAEVSDRPPVPSADQLLPSVELVTFPSQADGAAKRDTINGRERVAGWLDDMADRSRGDRVPFILQTAGVMVCEGAAVERGQYPVPEGTTGQPGSTANYLALWRPRGDDWQLERLWLAPPASLEGGDLAAGCVTEPWNLVVGAAAGVGSSGDVSRVVDALPPRYDEVSHSEGLSRPEVGIWVSISVTGWLRSQFHYGYRRHVEFHIQNFSSATGELIEELFVDARVHYLSVLAEARLGPVGVAVGPLGVETVMTGTYDGVYGSAEDSGLYTKLGGEARLFGGVHLSQRLRAVLSAGYRYVPGVDISEFLNTREAAYLYPGGLDLAVGLELVL